MAEKKQANPGAIQGTELISIASPFGGWVQAPVLADGNGHYAASAEGVEAPLTKQQANQYAESDGVTLFSPGKYGHLAPGHTFAAVTDAGGGTPHINALPLNGGNQASTFWVVLQNGRVVKMSSSTTVSVHDLTYGLVGSGHDHTGHTAVSTSNPDLFVMTDLGATQKTWAVWSWEDNTDADVGIFNTDGSQYIDAWFSALNGGVALLKGVPHKMCKGPDGNVYVLNGSNVMQVTLGATANLTAAVLGNTLPLGAGWTATGIVPYKNYVAITASYGSNADRGECALFLWNGQTSTVNGVTSTAPQFIFPIPDNYSNGLNFDGHILYVFTNGRNNSSKIFEFTGKDVKKVFETPFIQSSTNPIQGGVENAQDSMLIGTLKNPTGATSYAKLMRFYAGGFHDEGTVTDGTNNPTSIGMVKNFTLGYIYVGVKYGSTYAIFFDGNTLANYQTNVAFRTILYTQGILGRRMYPLGFKGTVNRIQIFLSQWGAGASLKLSLFKDYTAASVGGATDLLNKTVDTTVYPSGTTEIDLSDFAIADISSFYMIITWNHASISNTAAIIRRMLVHWTPSQ